MKNKVGYIYGAFVALMMMASQAWSSTGSVDVAANPDAGAVNPLNVQALSGNAEGNKFLSFTANILDTVKDKIDGTVKDVTAPYQEWSYSRGIGTIPNTCPTGYSPNAGLCAQDCPAGYDSVAGVCWQQCPAGYSDGGALCTLWKWWPETIAKKSWIQPRILMECPAGKQNEAGLCYEPCADTFTGVGALCFGQFGGLADQQRIREQAAEQHAAIANSGGIVIPEGQTPKLKVDMSFMPIVCGLDAIEGAFGLPIPDPTNLGAMGVDAAGDAIIGAISDQTKPSAWFVPSLSETVLFDFSAEATCEDDGVVAKAGMNFKPSVTVKASTRMFDPALHALAGVDLGVMQISIYELIPFRIYGTAGTTIGADTTLSATVDRTLPPVLIDGRQHATTTSLDVTPEMDVWLSSEAYLRITSFLSFIPDLLQVGAEFKLWVMELAMPYSIEEGVRAGAEGNEVFNAESLSVEVSSGRGFVNTFLRVLGIDIDAFGDDADVSWQGVSTQDVLFDREIAQPIAE